MKYEFKPFEKVLVRDRDDNNCWHADLFSHYNKDNDKYKYMTTHAGWECCIPFEGNEHLLGTTKMPGEKEKPFEWGEKLLLGQRNPLEKCMCLKDNNSEEVMICMQDGFVKMAKRELLSRTSDE